MHEGIATGPIYLDYNATTPVSPEVAALIDAWQGLTDKVVAIPATSDNQERTQ